MKIVVFLHGTAIMHRSGVGATREERVRQVIEGKDSSLRDYASYVPEGYASEKLMAWKNQGAEIIYLSSQKEANVANDQETLNKKVILDRWNVLSHVIFGGAQPGRVKLWHIHS